MKLWSYWTLYYCRIFSDKDILTKRHQLLPFINDNDKGIYYRYGFCFMDDPIFGLILLIMYDPENTNKTM